MAEYVLSSYMNVYICLLFSAFYIYKRRLFVTEFIQDRHNCMRAM